MNGFWMEMQRIQQRDEQKEEDGRGEAQLPEGEDGWKGLIPGEEM